MRFSRQKRRASDHSRGRWTAPGGPLAWLVRLAIVAAVIAAGVTWFVRSRSVVREDSPAWSPEGRIAFAADRNGAADLFEMSVDGRDRRALMTTDADERAPAYSSDGTKIAFDSNRDGNDEIYVLERFGDDGPPTEEKVRRVTNHRARDLAPAWSPDGAHIAFISDRDRPGYLDVYRMRADGTNVERLTTTGTSASPQFSPDGRRIALQVENGIHLFDLTTRTLLPLTRDATTAMHPTWSPDGKRLGFVSTSGGPSQIFTMNADGTEPKVLVSMARGGAINPRWSPDGARIAFVHVLDETATGSAPASSTRTIYVAEIATGKLTRLSR